MELTPRQIVNELDKYIIGQTEAKKVVAGGGVAQPLQTQQA